MISFVDHCLLRELYERIVPNNVARALAILSAMPMVAAIQYFSPLV